MELRVYYDDTDAGGVVYHANYLKYFERGRTEYLLKRGIDPAVMARNNQIFVVVWTELSFLAPAHLGETLIVEAFLESVSGATIMYDYKVWRKPSPGTSAEADLPRARQELDKGARPTENKLLVTGKTKMALVDRDMKVQRLSPEFVSRLKST